MYMNRHIDKEREMKVIQTESNKVSKNKKNNSLYDFNKKIFYWRCKTSDIGHCFPCIGITIDKEV